MTEQQFLIGLLREMATGAKPEDLQVGILDRIGTLIIERILPKVNDTSHVHEKRIQMPPSYIGPSVSTITITDATKFDPISITATPGTYIGKLNELAEDEWWATFYDYNDKSNGYLSKAAPMALSGRAVLHKFKKVF